MVKYALLLLLAVPLCYILFVNFRTGGPGEAGERRPGSYETITAEGAKDILDGEGDWILLDVRTEAEYAEGHIEGAILIPDYELAARAPEELPDRDARILLYCRSGNRSASAANTLAHLGYTDVYDFGGIIDWPYETVRE